MKKCPKCNKLIENDLAKFCRYCGSPLPMADENRKTEAVVEYEPVSTQRNDAVNYESRENYDTNETTNHSYQDNGIELGDTEPEQAKSEPSLWEYFVKCINKKYFQFKGRASRREFWGFCLFQLIIVLIPYLLLPFFLNSSMFQVIFGILFLIVLALFIPGLAVACRRLHDLK